MSLILEALRKSEAERRRAQVPDLLTEPQAAAPVAARTPQRWPWMAGGGLLVLVALWFATTRDATTVDAVANASADIAESAPARAIEPARPAPARPAPQLQRPLVLEAPTPAAATDASPAATAAAPSDFAIAEAPPTRPTSPPRPQPIAAAPAPAVPATPYVERVTDLASADRKQLPPLKLSMHMWNDVVAQRFVIIDGARLGVGDRLGAVIVADIVPDGVVLDWNGRALKLPLR